HHVCSLLPLSAPTATSPLSLHDALPISQRIDPLRQFAALARARGALDGPSARAQFAAQPSALIIDRVGRGQGGDAADHGRGGTPPASAGANRCSRTRATRWGRRAECKAFRTGRTCTAPPQNPPLGVSIRVRGNPVHVSNTAGGARTTLLQFELLS